MYDEESYFGKEYNRRKLIISIGALICIGFGFFGRTPGVTDFFSFAIGIVCARFAFKV